MFQNKQRYFFILVACLSLNACNQQPEIKKITGHAQDTTYSVSYWSENTVDQKQLQTHLADELTRIDRSISNYQDTSVIEKFNNNASLEPIEVNSEIVRLLNISGKVSKASNGCYDPTIFPAFRAWGFLDNELHEPTDEEFARLRENVGIKNVKATSGSKLQKKNSGTRLDLSSIGQGYSVSQLAHILDQAHVENYLVEIGGELQTRGHKPDGSHWRVAIEKPNHKRREVLDVIEVVTDAPTAIMTSGTYRHYYQAHEQQYSHIIDARSLSPVTHRTSSVTVIHNDATAADAWSTALLCLGSKKGLAVANSHHIKALFVDGFDKELIKVKSDDLANNQSDVALH